MFCSQHVLCFTVILLSLIANFRRFYGLNCVFGGKLWAQLVRVQYFLHLLCKIFLIHQRPKLQQKSFELNANISSHKIKLKFPFFDT